MPTPFFPIIPPPTFSMSPPTAQPAPASSYQAQAEDDTTSTSATDGTNEIYVGQPKMANGYPLIGIPDEGRTDNDVLCGSGTPVNVWKGNF